MRLRKPLRTYQLQAMQFLMDHQRSILADAPGVGKTLTALATSYQLGAKNILIVAPNNAVGVWRKELRESIGIEPVMYWGPITKRIEALSMYLSKPEGPIIVPTSMYAELHKLYTRQRFDVMIIDEAHHLRNRETLAFREAKRASSLALFELTGTPIVNGVMDLWPLLTLANPKIFSSYWAFANKFAYVEQGPFSKEVFGAKNLEGLKGMLGRFMIRRTIKDVRLELPHFTRQLVPIPMSKELETVYRKLDETKQYTATIDGLEQAMRIPSELAKITRLRQLVIDPRLAHIQHLKSGVLSALAEYVEADIKNGKSVVVFCPFTEAFPFIREYLQGVNVPIYELRGSQSAEVMTLQLEDFEGTQGPAILLASLQIASGWSATKAESAYFIGSDWTPAINTQAEARLYRYGQKNPVLVRYLYHEGTIDEYVMGIASGKARITDQVLA